MSILKLFAGRSLSFGSQGRFLLYNFLIMLSINAIGMDVSSDVTELKGSTKVIPKSFFGMHIHRADTTTTWPVAKFGTWRLMDTYVVWFNLEPEKGKWDFRRLDRLVEMAEKNKVEVLLPLGMTPAWASSRPTENSAYGLGHAAEPASMDDWRNYIRTVAQRYKGRIRYYEVWNEPNLHHFFTGDMAKMVELTRIAYEEFKKVDSGIQIVSPSATGNSSKYVKWLDNFLISGGGRYVDIIAYHLYVDNKPEEMLEIIREVRQVMKMNKVDNKLLWNTESGWRIENGDGSPDVPAFNYWKKLDHSNAGPYIVRSHVIAWAAGVERYCWYSWDHGMLGFIEPTTKVMKQHAVSAYAKTIKWLQGSVVKGCNKSGMIWSCALTDQKGRNVWLVWSDEEKAYSWNIPKDWYVTELESLDGSMYVIDMNRRTTLLINQSPLLLRARASVK